MRRPARIAALTVVGILLAGAVFFFGVLPDVVADRLNPVAVPPPYRASAEAERLHGSLLVADLHADPLLWSRSLLERGTYGHVDLPRLRDGNVAIQVFGAVTKVPRGQNYDRNRGDSDRLIPLAIAQWPPATWWGEEHLVARARHQARRLRDAAARSGEALVLLRSASDVETLLERRAQGAGGPVGALLAIEGMHAIEGDLRSLDTLYAAGFRMAGLAHFFDNELAGSAHGVRKGGLTPLGRAAVRRMEALGIIVDLAHASPRSVDDALDIATKPVVVSHAGVQGTCPGPRNLSDAQLRRIAANGGVVGIGFWDGAMCGIEPAAIAAAIRHAADVAGVDHVALGSDYDGAIRAYFDVTGLPLLTEALLDAGFGAAEIRKIMGENVLRVLRATLPR